MSLASPLEPEPAHDLQDEQPVVPEDDLLTDASTADGAPQDETMPDDELLAQPQVEEDETGEFEDVLQADAPKGLRTPEAGNGMTADELRSDLGE